MTEKTYIKDGEWNENQLNRFCRYLLRHGWIDMQDKKFFKNGLTIEVDKWGIFVWQGD